MSFFGRISMILLTAMALAAVNGCSPDDSSPMDDEKEPHFLLGNSRCNERDWDGAIKAYEDALEVNPHSAAAHYRLAMIFDTEQPDPAAAIYHYQQYLKLDPTVKNSDVIGQRILSCKIQLASGVSAIPDSPAMQKELEALRSQNQQLQAQVDKLNAELKDWYAYYNQVNATHSAAYNNNNSTPQTAAGVSPTPDDISTQPAQSNPQPQPQTIISKPAPAKPQKTHTHVVTSGETMASIARKHGISLGALESANPYVNPKKLHVGETLILP